MKRLLPIIQDKQAAIHQWLRSHEGEAELPLYSSVDIRNAGFKVAAIDTNLFPAGFNNLCEHGREDAVRALGTELRQRVPGCRRVLVMAEEHTRNGWYLENVRILQSLIEQAGFEARVATVLSPEPLSCSTVNFVELETATGASIRVYSARRVLKDAEAGDRPDMIIMNNDLSKGIPDVLRASQTPIYPSLQAGWHSRYKSHHFSHLNILLKELADLLGTDPWRFSCLDALVDGVDVFQEKDRARLAESAADLLDRTAGKYREHGISEKPFVFIKSDNGTYGMAVEMFEDPEDIYRMNRRVKNKLFKGKGSQVVSRYLLQEGVPTVHSVDDQVGEACIYQVAQHLVGGFYRVHGEKSNRENLNAKGVTFKTLCPHSARYGDCGVHTDVNIFDLYRILARVSGIAAHREIRQLEKAVAQ